jgi:hypothetical protein
VALARGFEEARREAIREAWSVGGFFCCCWLGEVEKARVALLAIDGRDDVFCGWRCKRWRRVCWRRERTQELQIVEFDMVVNCLLRSIGVVSVLLKRGIVSLASDKVALLSGDDLTTAVSTTSQASQSERLDAAAEYSTCIDYILPMPRLGRSSIDDCSLYGHHCNLDDQYCT